MGRYGPPVYTQDESGQILAQAFLHAGDDFVAERARKRQEGRQAVADADAKRARDLAYYEGGGRTGTAPQQTVHVGGATPLAMTPSSGPAVDTGPALGAAFLAPGVPDLTGRSSAPPAVPQPDPEQFGARRSLPPGATSFLPNSPAPTGTPMDEAAPPRIHPGAFDLTTRSFHGSSLPPTPPAPAVDLAPVDASRPDPRYTQLDATHYVDQEGTPRAEAARDRATNLALADKFRQADIGARGGQAMTLEQLRQQGRGQLRDSINGNALTAIALRAMLAGNNQEAHDDRTATAGAAHDARVTDRVITGPGGRASAASEANAQRLGAAVIEASGGNYDDAVDWLENTPEGQAAAKKGLTKAHLYAGLGAFIKNQAATTARMTTGYAGMEVPEATTKVGEIRKAVTPPRRAGTTPAPAAAAPPAGSSTPAPGAAAAPPAPDPEAAAKAAWVQANPPTAGESRDQYRARYEASKKKPPTK